MKQFVFAFFVFILLAIIVSVIMGNTESTVFVLVGYLVGIGYVQFWQKWLSPKIS